MIPAIRVALMLLTLIPVAVAAQTSPQWINYGPESTSFSELRVPPGAGPFPVAVLIHGGAGWRPVRALPICDRWPKYWSVTVSPLGTWSTGASAMRVETGRVPFAILSTRPTTCECWPVPTLRCYAYSHRWPFLGRALRCVAGDTTPVAAQQSLSQFVPLQISGLVTLDAFLDPRVMDSPGVDGRLYCDEPVLARLSPMKTMPTVSSMPPCACKPHCSATPSGCGRPMASICRSA